MQKLSISALMGILISISVPACDSGSESDGSDSTGDTTGDTTGDASTGGGEGGEEDGGTSSEGGEEGGSGEEGGEGGTTSDGEDEGTTSGGDEGGESGDGDEGEATTGGEEGESTGDDSANMVCEEGCAALWACTQIEVDGERLCPALDPSEDPYLEEAFIEGCVAGENCEVIAELAGDGTDPAQCEMVLTLLSEQSTDFDEGCNGLGSGE